MPKHYADNNPSVAHFTYKQAEIFKGFGILLIVLHNFFHNLTPVIGQNEFSFNHNTFVRYYSSIIENPFDIIRSTFSYWGHYGVEIFIFFSAYGLTRKYLHSQPNTLHFLKRRFEKIYISFLICVAVYVALGIIKEQISPEK